MSKRYYRQINHTKKQNSSLSKLASTTPVIAMRFNHVIAGFGISQNSSNKKQHVLKLEPSGADNVTKPANTINQKTLMSNVAHQNYWLQSAKHIHRELVALCPSLLNGGIAHEN